MGGAPAGRLALAALVLLTATALAGAQPPAKARVGLLGVAPDSMMPTFRESLRELGWVTGENLLIEERYAKGGDLARIPGLAADLVKLRVDVIVTVGNTATGAAKVRVPAMYESRAFVEAGGLMSYGADRGAGYRRVAAQVDRILRGARPAELPVEQATRIEFVVNEKTAKALGITLSPQVLSRADEVIR
ncbi:MAG TPA: ABC transporter substrate binding protein [Methylomirabilota bacterium]|nr:ABC transporter substrate binding protein [Methylomirabilota bacterium]